MTTRVLTSLGLVPATGTSQSASIAAQAKAQALAQQHALTQQVGDPRKRSKWDSAPKR